MAYTAIIKDGGLFIPNVFSELDDGSSHIVQIELDLDEVREQLEMTEAPKETKTVKKALKKPPKKATSKQTQSAEASTLGKGDIGELQGLNDVELSEIIKAYMNDESESS